MYNEETYIEPQYSKQMSNDEVIYYMTRYKSGDLEARKKIIESYISYVKLIVRSNFKGGIYEEDDLIAIGIHGLIKSVDKFDLDRYNKFKSFATKCIFNEIFYFMRKSKKHYINDKITSMSDLDNVENLIVDKNVNIEADYEKKAIINDILNIIKLLPEKEKRIMYMYFSINTNKKYTQADIAKKINIAQSSVSKTIKQILKYIRNVIDEIEEPNFVGFNNKQKRLLNNKE